MKKVTIVGIGMGNAETLTAQAKKVIDSADLIIGAARMVDSFENKALKAYHISSTEIADCIDKSEAENIAVLMSGDTGFFSGTKILIGKLSEIGINPCVIAGISSMSYFASKIGISYDDARAISMHGREVDILPYILENNKVFLLTDSKNTPNNIAKSIAKYQNDGILIYVGENLSYADEKITMGTPSEIADGNFNTLSVMYVINENPNTESEFGLDDECFTKTNSPMTKSEVRAVCLSKLRIKPSDICYDIGSGTGSVTVEMARIAKFGKVFALEKNTEGVRQTRENAEKFKLSNIEVIEALAPEGLEQLPAPNTVFIGGSSGNLHEIIEAVLNKNPKARIVTSAITLETVNEATSAILKFGLINTDICQITVAKSKKLGKYNMMMGQNPIYIISGDGDKYEI